MNYSTSRYRQQGVTLVIGLILLVLITLVVTTAFSLSSTNLRSVGNMQIRDEAIAAGNSAIESVISTNFYNVATLPPGNPMSYSIDINHDGVTDYTVTISSITCKSTANAIKESISSVTLGSSFTSTAFYNTIWEIVASVQDTKSGASVVVSEGVRALISGDSSTDANARSHCNL